ncbi:MAG TPA: GAF domain-containing sensor histidine kinase [Candidatus Limnocylindria bacterium]|nr:GAF domain-containing sensor histidine kinase [Candidatus Limnocylindria bacterium]
MSVRLDADFWSARMAFLCKLARADAVAVVLEVQNEGFVTYAADNIPADPGWNGAVAGPLIRAALDSRTSAQASVVLPLADGRAASTIFVAPIVWNDQLVGGLAALRASGSFDERDSAEVERLADLVGLELAEATALRRAQSQQSELETRLRAQAKIADLARNTQDPDELLQRATAQLAELFGADGVSIMLADDAGQLSVRSSLGLSDAAKKDRKKLGEGISGYVAKTGQPLLLTGQVKDQRFSGNDPTIGESIVAPLRAADRTIGVVNVKHSAATKERFTQASVDSLQQVASEIASSFVAADAMRRTEDDRKQALVLYELSRLATMGNDPQQDLETAADMIAGMLNNDVVGVWALDTGGGVRLRAGHGYPDPLPEVIPVSGIGPAMTMALREEQLATARFAAGDERRPDWAAGEATMFVLAPIGSHGNQLGALVLGRASGQYSDPEIEFGTTLGEYLSGQMQKTAAGDSQEVIAANERRKIAQEIHDGIAQELTGVVLTLEACQRALDKDPAALSASLAKAAREARATLAEVRQYMSALRAKEGGDINLPSTVARLVDDVRRQTGLRVEMEEQGAERELEPPLERAVMRIVGESLRNVAQHAQANAAKLRLTYGEREITVIVEDDGVGFDTEPTMATATDSGHFGLAGMRERAESIGGTLTVLSQPGRGSVITATLPYMFAEDPVRTMKDPTPVVEDVESPAERSGLISKLFGR